MPNKERASNKESCEKQITYYERAASSSAVVAYSKPKSNKPSKANLNELGSSITG